MERDTLQQAVRLYTPEEYRQLTEAAKSGEPGGKERVCGALAYAAYTRPGAIPQAFGGVAAGWLEQTEADEPISGEPLPLDETFWAEFWSVVDGANEGYDATTITLRSAALAAFVSPDYQSAAEDAATLYAGGTEVYRHESRYPNLPNSQQIHWDASCIRCGSTMDTTQRCLIAMPLAFRTFRHGFAT